MAVPMDDGIRRARDDAAESNRRLAADAEILASVDFITSALREIRSNDRFAERVRDTFREHG